MITVCAWCEQQQSVFERESAWARLRDEEVSHGICDRHFFVELRKSMEQAR